MSEAAAIASVGRALGLPADWLNPGPTELLRLDQICFKLYATVDQGMNSKHAADLRALRPTAEELLAAGQWSRTHDPSEGYRLELVEILVTFGVADANDHV